MNTKNILSIANTIVDELHQKIVDMKRLNLSNEDKLVALNTIELYLLEFKKHYPKQ